MIKILSIILLLLAFACESRPKPRPKFVERKVVPEVAKSVSEWNEQLDTTKRIIRYYTHAYDRLSSQFTVKLNLKTIETYYHEPFIWTMTVYDKTDSLIFKQVQECFLPDWIWKISDWQDVRSFETHHREKAIIADGYTGHLVLGDFNFDSLTDIALLSSYGNAGRAEYCYYIQQSTGKFKKDQFFSEKVKLLPEKTDPVRRKFQTSSPCCGGIYYDYYTIDSLGKCRTTGQYFHDFSKYR